MTTKELTKKEYEEKLKEKFGEKIEMEFVFAGKTSPYVKHHKSVNKYRNEVLILTGSEHKTFQIRMSLKFNKDNQPIYSSSGSYRGGAGQCLDTIKSYYLKYLNGENKQLLKDLVNLWNRNHLNDMNAECEHQRAENWGGEEITLKNYKLKNEFLNKQIEIKRSIEKSMATMGTCTISEEYKKIYNLPYTIKDVETKLDDSIIDFYDIEEEYTKSNTWLYQTELTPSGVLAKPCPVCGYKYGTSWLYREISLEDLQLIEFIFDKWSNENE